MQKWQKMTKIMKNSKKTRSEMPGPEPANRRILNRSNRTWTERQRPRGGTPFGRPPPGGAVSIGSTDAIGGALHRLALSSLAC